MLGRPVTMVAIGVVLFGVSAFVVLLWRFAIFVLPITWTGEADRIAQLLRVERGSVVADIGAGDGTFAIEMARQIGSGGVVYATELATARVAEIKQRAAAEGLGQVRAVAAAADATNLPDACCDAIYLRTVFHHIQDRDAFAREVQKALRTNGRLAVIDFAPGELWFHGRDHGVASERVVEAFQRAGLRCVQRIENWGGGTYLMLFERARADS